MIKVDPAMISSLMLKLSSSMETPFGYGSEISGETNIVDSGTPVDGKPTMFTPVEAEPATTVDPEMARFMDDGDVAPKNESAPAVKEEGIIPEIINSPDSAPDKEFMQTPWVKPPRREHFNESRTRGYRNEYQREYRAEHGNE